MIAENEDELQEEVRQRFAAWRASAMRPRKYALLVAGFYHRYRLDRSGDPSPYRELVAKLNDFGDLATLAKCLRTLVELRGE